MLEIILTFCIRTVFDVENDCSTYFKQKKKEKKR